MDISKIKESRSKEMAFKLQVEDDNEWALRRAG